MVSIRIGLQSIPLGVRSRRPARYGTWKPVPPRPVHSGGKANMVVEEALRRGREQEAITIKMLRELQAVGLDDMAEFDQLTERLDQVQAVIQNALRKLA